jgi:tetratricopeptide (TPR) repeat protein
MVMTDEAAIPSAGLGAGATQSLAGPAAAAAPQRLPRTIGQFRILRLIAEGGMGAVYEAEQEQPHRRVALKLIKSGFATDEQRRRFEREADALGRLQHPGIAQIYQAGSIETEYGPQPYFAMELIAGQRLWQYAEQHHLQLRSRLELMIQICDAVQHAHQRGIIHRDLKPANILVDANGQVKILDFGVARITDVDVQATRQTELGQIVGTLPYMSPEQVAGDPFEIDHRADIYALGVILYQLLAGRLPFDVERKTLPEAVHVIRDQDAPALSSIDRVYRGDVEIIVGKALEKEKSRRYESALELASDVRRYLRDEPILARPPSASYQLAKFTRRHRGLVVGTAAVFFVLLAGIAVSSFESVRARHAERAARESEAQARSQRDRALSAEATAATARDRAISAERVAESERDHAVKAEARATSERDLAIAERRRADSEAAIEKAVSGFLQDDLLAQASSTEQTNSKPDPDIRVRTVLDRAAKDVSVKFAGQPLVEASIERTIGRAYDRLALYSEAQLHLGRALSLYRQHLGAESREALHTASILGDDYRGSGKLAEAEALLLQTVHTYSRLDLHSTESLEAADSLADVYLAQSKPGDAEPLLVSALEVEQKTLPPDHRITLDTMNSLARVYFVTGRYPQAEKTLLALIASCARIYGDDNPRTLGKMNNLAVLYQRMFRFGEAETLYTKIMESERRALGPEHPETLNIVNNLAVLLMVQGKYAQAEPLFDQVLTNWRKTLGPEHPRTLTLLSNIAVMKQGQQKYGEAEALWQSVLQVRRRTLGDQHADTIETVFLLGLLDMTQNKTQAAELRLTEVLAARRRVLGPRHSETLAAMDELGELRNTQGRHAEAEALLRECLEIQKQTTPDDFRRYRTESLLGASLAGEQRYAEAEPLLLSGYEGMKQREAATIVRLRPKIKKGLQDLIALYVAWGKPERAAAFQDQLNSSR